MFKRSLINYWWQLRSLQPALNMGIICGGLIIEYLDYHVAANIKHEISLQPHSLGKKKSFP